MKLLFLLLFTTSIFSQNKIEYFVSFPKKEHRHIDVKIKADNLKEKVIEFRFSRSSPGRYAIHEFAKNVFNVRFTDDSGKELNFNRVNSDQWNVEGHNGSVTAEYTLFADRADGTYAQVNSEHAHLNIPATFMFLRQYKDREIIVNFDLKQLKDWKVATQLKEIDSDTYSAPNHYYFMDSPIEISNHDLLSWNHNNQTIQMAIHHDTSQEDIKTFFEMSKYVILEQEAIFGELAKYDFGKYTFLADYLSYVSGDGMEHRNSTIVSSSRSLKGNLESLIGTVSHEFFHSWNVERLRPKSLEPFDFENANMSGELWLAEGFTSYYDGLTIHRAGLNSVDDFAKSLAGKLNYVLLSPGSKFHSPKEMSYQAPFVDAASSIDPHYRSNIFISYYSFGAVIGLGLDLQLRSEFNKNLDDFMKLLWAKFGKIEKPYTLDDIQNSLAEFTNKNFADNFFKNHIHGNKYIDYKSLLIKFGLRLEEKEPEKKWVGSLRFNKNTNVVSSYTRINDPIYKAGIDKGDTIVTFNNKTIKSIEDFNTILETLEIDKAYDIEYKQLGKTIKKKIAVKSNPSFDIKVITQNLNSSQKSLRENWLKSMATKKLSTLTRNCEKCDRHFDLSDRYCTFDGTMLTIKLK
jgi:predicted metalloprotease with PDZ domain